MPPEPTIPLLEADADLGRFLADDERGLAGRAKLPVKALPEGTLDLVSLSPGEAGAPFGALLIDGAVIHRLRLAGHSTIRLLGPGDPLALGFRSRSALSVDSSYDVIGETSVALLGNDFLVAIRRWPALASALYLREAEEADRIAAHLVISQLPRVAERILGVLWLLAESWGHVTPAGVTLPLSLTHDAIGELIGARRSTVTLALGELIDRGALIRQDSGWLLLEAFPDAAPGEHGGATVEPLAHAPTAWRQASVEREDPADAYRELRETVARLHAEHVLMRESVTARLARARETRDRVTRRRRELALTRPTPPPAPSS